ncbi:HAMP domain-containing histidine kinase [Bacillus sp. DNRA2]|uniref:sensor histidine kinase n=1 Tax=Bacillus sp. DNRA2 TaxID=2723053 RepID=UPI00145D74B8|nr:sensor histidine kinase [Bacillus sp. DNRA2]NMD68944.1 HAMP domain-containing histidine kinase [Bacillus sp. DNRA2]
MSFIEYVKDKRYFLLFFMIVMVFTSIILIVSVDGEPLLSNLLYMNISCMIFAVGYLTAGYFHHRRFYLELKGAIDSKQREIAAILPEPQNTQHKLFLELIEKFIAENDKQLQTLLDEKRDGQDFIMTWIHEVKLPIAASRLIMENSSGKTVDSVVDKLEDELNKIDQYVEQALYYSRIDTFSKDYFIAEISLNKIVKNSVKKYAKLFINKAIRFEMKDMEQFVHSDSKWLGFIVDQILANSLKYTDVSGEIAVYFDEDNKAKRLIIQDNGIGISPEDIGRVFDKGFTGATGRSHTKSTGIGLYLAKQLAQKLGHRLTIESEQGSYTKLIIHFPKIRNYYHL